VTTVTMTMRTKAKSPTWEISARHVFTLQRLDLSGIQHPQRPHRVVVHRAVAQSGDCIDRCLGDFGDDGPRFDRRCERFGRGESLDAHIDEAVRR